MTCPFCHPESAERLQVVLENEHCLLLQEPQEVLVGSALIVPRVHREAVFDLTPE